MTKPGGSGLVAVEGGGSARTDPTHELELASLAQLGNIRCGRSSGTAEEMDMLEDGKLSKSTI
ncbi:hypothetical protein E4U54_000388 [Claviceps lovelessii]|nr:hypothetical protein E4U54_000388 [Claviceps lovelessii]